MELKTQKIGDLAVSIVQRKNDLTVTEEALLTDKSGSFNCAEEE